MRFFLSRLSTLLLCVLLGCAHARAETVEQVTNPRRAAKLWVSDMARVLDDDTERRLNALSKQLEKRTGAEMAIVTVQRTDGLEPKPFATKLFNLWGIGKRGRDNGVLLLLVMEARRVEVETGNGMEGVLPDAHVPSILPDSRVQSILNERAVPRFRAGDYAGGVLATSQEIARIIERSAAPSQPKDLVPQRQGAAAAPARATAAPRSLDAGSSSSSPQPAPSSTGWLPLAAGAVLLPLGGWAALRSRVRHCPQCQQKMKRLSEVEDDALLAFDQKFEENLGSVDYRAWKCESCGATTVERAVKWLSGYSDCPRCSHRTVSSQTTILRHPTYTSHGESLTVRTCRFPRCNFRDEERRTLPVKPRPTQHSSGGHSLGSHSHSSGSSSSSSSGSFGGGSSSGGGAGASW